MIKVNATRTTAAMEQMVTNSKPNLGIETRSGHYCNKEALKQVHTKLMISALKRADIIVHF